MKFVHAADVHLDSPMRGLDAYEGAPTEALRDATRRAFENLMELCVSEQVQLLVLAGDLFDGDWKNYDTGLYFRGQLARLGEAGVRVAFVRGNHDAASRMTRQLPLPAHVHCFSKRRPETLRLEELGVAVHGQSFAKVDVRDKLVSQYPAPVPGWLNIGVLHTALEGRPGHDSYAPCNLEDLLARGYDYWALGHVHQREELSQAPWVGFSGCLQGRHVREPGAKGCYVVSTRSGRVESVEFQSVDVVRWSTLRVDAAAFSDTDALLAAIHAGLVRERENADGRLLAVRVQIDGESELHEQLERDPVRFTHAVRGLGVDLGEVWLEKVVLATAPPTREVASTLTAGALGELFRGADAASNDTAWQAAMTATLGKLYDKLPPEVRSSEELQELLAPDGLARLTSDARSLLGALLLGGGEPE